MLHYKNQEKTEDKYYFLKPPMSTHNTNSNTSSASETTGLSIFEVVKIKTNTEGIKALILIYIMGDVFGPLFYPN